MFDLDTFLNAAKSGGRVDAAGFLEYLKGFPEIIIWGAGPLGKAIGNKLMNLGICHLRYWDIRSESIISVNGLPVSLPYPSDVANRGTLVILAIGNRLALVKVQEELYRAGHRDVLLGYLIYQATVCPFDADLGIDPRVCAKAETCVAQWCERIYGIVHKRCTTKEPSRGEVLRFNVIQFVINQRCTLSCMYCNSYLNRYPQPARIDIPTERVLADIDQFMAAVDSVGVIGIQGGEPFMHRDLSTICKHLLSKPNFGVAYIASSATSIIRPEQLEGLQDPRLFVSLSNYQDVLTSRQKQIYEQNIQTLQQAGVCYRTYHVASQWSIPSKLNPKGHSMEVMTAKKQGCWFPDCLQIKAGRMHTCDFGAAVHGLKVADYPDSYVDMAEHGSVESLRSSILAWKDRPYYSVCGHCESPLGFVDHAAEQGYLDFSGATDVFPRE